jgi:glutathione S-transferase
MVCRGPADGRVSLGTREIDMKLFDNAFSPFARKVRIALDHKGISADIVNGLDRTKDDVTKVNERGEVPALVDGKLTVVNSADIVAYLDHKFPTPSLYPPDPALRARARAWERCADATVDPILVDISYWLWASRSDTMPQGLLDAARTDLERCYVALEEALQHGDFLCGELSIAEVSLFPHLAATRTLQVPFSGERHPKLVAWYKRLRNIDIFQADLERSREAMANIAALNLDTERIFWRGDRVEWLLARGYHQWFFNEIESGRVLWPGLGLPPS